MSQLSHKIHQIFSKLRIDKSYYQTIFDFSVQIRDSVKVLEMEITDEEKKLINGISSAFQRFSATHRKVAPKESLGELTRFLMKNDYRITSMHDKIVWYSNKSYKNSFCLNHNCDKYSKALPYVNTPIK